MASGFIASKATRLRWGESATTKTIFVGELRYIDRLGAITSEPEQTIIDADRNRARAEYLRDQWVSQIIDQHRLEAVGYVSLASDLGGGELALNKE
jgi:hypothetical protein